MLRLFWSSLPHPRGNAYLLAYSDRTSRHIAPSSVSAATLIAARTVKIFVNPYMPSWSCPAHLFSGDGPHDVFYELSHAIYKLLRTTRPQTSSYHLQTDGGFECPKHTIGRMLSTVVKERLDDWNLCPPHIGCLQRFRLHSH